MPGTALFSGPKRRAKKSRWTDPAARVVEVVSDWLGLVDQFHDLCGGQGGHFIAVLVLEPLVDLLPV